MQATAPRAAHLRILNMAAVKAGAVQFEPALRLPSLPSISQKQDNRGTAMGNDIYVMTTLSPFNPGATHIVRQSRMALSRFPPRATVPALANAASKTVLKKPWPYSLPRFLQPQRGTTYAQMYGDASTSSPPSSMDNATTQSDKSDRKEKSLSAVQAALYGVPEPKEYRYMGEIVREGEFLYKVLYGGKEKEGEEMSGENKKWKSKLKKSRMQLALEAESGEYENEEYLGDGGQVYGENGKFVGRK